MPKPPDTTDTTDTTPDPGHVLSVAAVLSDPPEAQP